MKRLMVATDLTEHSGTALRRAVSVASTLNTELHVVHIVDGEFPLTIGEVERENAQAAIRTQLSTIPGCGQVRTVVVAFFGEPGSDIAGYARDHKIDMIIMGQHRHRGVIEVLSGSTIDRLASAAKVAVLVATRDVAGAYSRAVVGVDFSECAAKAVTIAARLVGATKLLPIHTYRPSVTSPSISAGQQEGKTTRDKAAKEASLHQEIDTWKTTYTLPDQMPEVALLQGEAAEILAQVAFESRADLICVGAHNKSWLATQFLGSTALELLSQSKLDAPQYRNVDLLIVPL